MVHLVRRAIAAVLAFVALIVMTTVSYVWLAHETVQALEYVLMGQRPDPSPSEVVESVASWKPEPSWILLQDEAGNQPVPSGCAITHLFSFGPGTGANELAAVAATVCGSSGAALYAHRLTVSGAVRTSDVGLPVGNAVPVVSSQGVGWLWVQGTTAYQFKIACESTIEACKSRSDEQFQSLSGHLPGEIHGPGAKTYVKALGTIVGLVAVWGLITATSGALAAARLGSWSPPLEGDVTGRVRRLWWAVRVLWAARLLTFLGLVFTLMWAWTWLSKPDDGELGSTLIAMIVGCCGFLLWRWARREAKSLPPRQRLLTEDSAVADAGIGLFWALRLAWLQVIGWAVLTAVAVAASAELSPPILIEQIRSSEKDWQQTPGWHTAALLASRNVVAAAAIDPTILMVFALVPQAVLIFFASRLAKRLYAATLQSVVRADERKPQFLFLRSFEEDRTRIPTVASRDGFLPRWIRLTGRRRFEETLAEALAAHRPVIALDPPGKRLRSLGAAKTTLPMDGWKGQIEQYANDAYAVVVLATPPTINPGLQWEIELLGERLTHGRLIVVIGPYPALESARRATGFLMATGLRGWFAGLHLDLRRGVMIAARSTRGHWRFYGATKRTDISYALAIDEAMRDADSEWAAEIAGQSE